MTVTLKKVALSTQSEIITSGLINENHLGMIGNIQVNCQVRLGTLTATVEQLRQIKHGQIMDLDQKTNDPIEIVLNDHVIARGELMSCDDHFAVQITEVFS